MESAKLLGATTPFLRPKELSEDHVSLEEVLQYSVVSLNVPSGQINRLRELGIIGTEPVGSKGPRPLSLTRQKELGWIQETDEDYQSLNDI